MNLGTRQDVVDRLEYAKRYLDFDGINEMVKNLVLIAIGKTWTPGGKQAETEELLLVVLDGLRSAGFTEDKSDEKTELDSYVAVLELLVSWEAERGETALIIAQEDHVIARLLAYKMYVKPVLIEMRRSRTPGNLN